MLLYALLVSKAIQWGHPSVNRGGNKDVSFQISYKSTYITLVCDNDYTSGQDNTRCNSFSTTKFSVYSGASYVVSYISMGKQYQWQFIEKHTQYGLHQINFVIKFNSECLNIQLSKGNGIYETPYSDEDNNPHTNDYFMIGGTASGNSSYTQIGNIYGYFIGY